MAARKTQKSAVVSLAGWKKIRAARGAPRRRTIAPRFRDERPQGEIHKGNELYRFRISFTRFEMEQHPLWPTWRIRCLLPLEGDRALTESARRAILAGFFHRYGVHWPEHGNIWFGPRDGITMTSDEISLWSYRNPATRRSCEVVQLKLPRTTGTNPGTVDGELIQADADDGTEEGLAFSHVRILEPGPVRVIGIRFTRRRRTRILSRHATSWTVRCNTPFLRDGRLSLDARRAILAAYFGVFGLERRGAADIVFTETDGIMIRNGSVRRCGSLLRA